ncbi:hypothetical protein LCGC14_2949610 [marine sediment metagenome]|uniref:Uncharacterized protein n=1 Tax=marine sediment metagenome TaxID=412755 RepID=A0A0F8Y2X0_9ZZZZ
MEHKLMITPAINPKLRHAIENVLEEFDYDVHGGGTYVKGLAWSDITFSGNHPLDLNKPDGCLDSWFDDGRGDVEQVSAKPDNCTCPECPEDCHRSGLMPEAEVHSDKQGRCTCETCQVKAALRRHPRYKESTGMVQPGGIDGL